MQSFHILFNIIMLFLRQLIDDNLFQNNIFMVISLRARLHSGALSYCFSYGDRAVNRQQSFRTLFITFTSKSYKFFLFFLFFLKFLILKKFCKSGTPPICAGIGFLSFYHTIYIFDIRSTRLAVGFLDGHPSKHCQLDRIRVVSFLFSRAPVSRA